MKASSTVCHIEDVNYTSTQIENMYKYSFSELHISYLLPAAYLFKVTEMPAGYNLFMKDFVYITGAKLNNPLTDSMPVDKDDPKMWDQDGDENPGIRIDTEVFLPMIGGPGTMDIAERTIAEININTVNENKIAGSSKWLREQVVFQTSNEFFTKGEETSVIPDDEKSTFILIRVDDSYNCAKIKAQKDSLFK